MEAALSAPADLEAWTGEDVGVADIERQLAALRRESAVRSSGTDLRTSVMTHMAWVPVEWMDAARQTLDGLAERHPSRTIILVPAPEADDGLDANVSLRCFPVRDGHGNVCSEVIELRLRGKRASVPASIVTPLLISDLPAFLRWRGQPPFGEVQFEQLVDVVDRLVVDSAEWDDLPDSFARLAEIFDRVVVSDIAWSRSLLWRRELASLWPGIAEVRELRVDGPYADALLLAGWLQDRLGHAIDVRHNDADVIESVEVDGEPVPRPRGEIGTPSDLLSEELDRFGRDPVYEAAVRAIPAGD